MPFFPSNFNIFKKFNFYFLSFQVNLYGLKALFMSNIGLHYEFIYKMMVPSSLLYNRAYFDARFPTLEVSNK